MREKQAPGYPRFRSSFWGLCAGSLCAVLLNPGPSRGQTQPAAPATKQEPAAPAKLAVPENLVTTGVPDVPMELVDKVARYTESRAAMLLGWHPVRKEMLIATRFGDTPQLHLVTHPGGARRQLTFFNDRVGSGHFYKGKGNAILFSKDVGGGEFFQLYRFDMKTSAITLLTDGKSRNVGPRFSNSGKLLVFNSTQRNGQDTDFYVMDPEATSPAKNGARLLSQVQGGGWSAPDFSPDDKTVLVQEALSVNESYLWLMDAATGKMTPLIERTPGSTDKVAYGEAAFSKDGRGVYVTTDKDSEFQRLAYIDLKTRAHEFLTTSIRWNVESFDLSKDGKRIAFITNEDGVGVLHLLDTTTKKELRPKLPPGSVLSCLWHDNSKVLGFTMTSAQSPPDAYSLEVGDSLAENGQVERWTESESAVDPRGLPEPTVIRWKSFDGKMISGLYYRPPARFTGPRPVIVDIHGGPEGQARPIFLGRRNYWLSELGVAIIFPNVRGSSGYGKTFLKLDNGERREDSVKDIGALLDWIGTSPKLDKRRVMITGGSYGGYMTLAVATTYSDRIACSIDVVGISNFVTFLQRTEAYRRDLRRVEYGDERDPQMRAFLERISPLSRADKIGKPLFVVQGKNDPRVPYTEAEQIVESLRKRNTPVWYLLAKDEGHGFAKKKNADFQFYAMVLFAQKHLLSQGPMTH